MLLSAVALTTAINYLLYFPRQAYPSFSRLWTRQFVCLPLYSHISTYMTDALHWLPVASCIQYKVLVLSLQNSTGSSSKISLQLNAETCCIFPPSPVYRSTWSPSSPVKDWHGPTTCLCHRGPFYVEWPPLQSVVRFWSGSILIPSLLQDFYFLGAVTLRAPLNSLYCKMRFINSEIWLLTVDLILTRANWLVLCTVTRTKTLPVHGQKFILPGREWQAYMACGVHSS